MKYLKLYEKYTHTNQDALDDMTYIQKFSKKFEDKFEYRLNLIDLSNAKFKSYLGYGAHKYYYGEVEIFNKNTIEDDSPQIGSYVVIQPENAGYSKKFMTYMTTNIGQITNIEIFKMFNEIRYSINYTNNNDYSQGPWLFSKKEITFHSPNKKDCEIFLSTKKYNL